MLTLDHPTLPNTLRPAVPDVLHQLLDLIRLELHIDSDGMNLATPLSQLAMDSLEWVELLMVIEDRFGVPISDQQGQALRTLGDLVH